MNLSDEERLLPLVPKRDESAFEALYGMYAERLRLAAWRLCRRRDLADDLANETWCRAYRARGDYEPGRPFLAWLCGFLQNVWREHLREHAQERQRIESQKGLEDSNISSQADSPDAAAADAEVLLALQACFERLSQDERDLVRWRFFDKLPLRAIAQRLKIAEATVRENRLPAAMAKIEKCLKAKGIPVDFFGFSTAQTGGILQKGDGERP